MYYEISTRKTGVIIITSFIALICFTIVGSFLKIIHNNTADVFLVIAALCSVTFFD